MQQEMFGGQERFRAITKGNYSSAPVASMKSV